MMILASCLAGIPAQADVALMPLPAKLSTAAEGRLPINGPFQVEWTGHRDAALDAAIKRFDLEVQRRSGLALRGAGPRLRIEVARAGPRIPSLEMQEAYTLAVTADGVALTAQQPAGVLRGLATLRQLLSFNPEGFGLPRLHIEDATRFAWRGLMIDVARHFISLSTIKRQIDAMERVKLNVLHLHLSDTEAFRVESKRFPRLTEVSARGGHFTQDEIRELVAYASARGVRVVPEFDVPGHTGAMLVAYPEHSAGPVNAADPVGIRGVAMDPSRPETYAFIRALFGEMAALFPDAYFHVGGDEVSAAAWANNPRIQAYMAAQGLADRAALQRHFFHRVKAVLDELGKITVGWEEVADGPIDDGVLVQAWRSSEATMHITAQNNRAIVSAGYYLDLLWPGLSYYAIDPLDPLATHPDRPGDVIGPKPTGPLTPSQAALVIGAEAPMWAEVITDEMADGRIWPRAALLAERFWSPASVRDPVDASRRLVPVHEGLRIGGLADDAQRHRMAARLAPEDANALETLAAVTAPIRNFGRLWEVIAAARSGRPLRPPELNTPADIATPDSVEMHRLAGRIDRFIAGDRLETEALATELKRYRDNHARLSIVARGKPLLEPALPISADVAALAQAGLDAITLIQSGTRPDVRWRQEANALLQRQADAEAASASIPKVWTGAAQPPANLLISITPAIARLLRAAGL